VQKAKTAGSSRRYLGRKKLDRRVSSDEGKSVERKADLQPRAPSCNVPLIWGHDSRTWGGGKLDETLRRMGGKRGGLAEILLTELSNKEGKQKDQENQASEISGLKILGGGEVGVGTRKKGRRENLDGGFS